MPDTEPELIDSVVTFLGDLNTQTLRWELKKLHAIRDWALGSLGIDYAVGDRVAIVEPIPTNNGWAAYEEALAIGATGIVDAIDFAPHNGRWYAAVVLDHAWQVSGPGLPLMRWWKGRASETPPWAKPPNAYEQQAFPNGKRKKFMLDFHWVAKHGGTPVLMAPSSAERVGDQP